MEYLNDNYMINQADEPETGGDEVAEEVEVEGGGEEEPLEEETEELEEETVEGE